MAFEASPNGHDPMPWSWAPKSRSPAIVGDDGEPRPIRLIAEAPVKLGAAKPWELVFSVVDLALGLAIVNDHAVGTGSILVVAVAFLGFWGMVSFLLGLGTLGAVALALNHIYPRNPIWSRLRAFCDLSRVMLWYTYVYSMSLTFWETKHMSPMVIIGAGFIVYGVYILTLAARDVIRLKP